MGLPAAAKKLIPGSAVASSADGLVRLGAADLIYLTALREFPGERCIEAAPGADGLEFCDLAGVCDELSQGIGVKGLTEVVSIESRYDDGSAQLGGEAVGERGHLITGEELPLIDADDLCLGNSAQLLLR